MEVSVYGKKVIKRDIYQIIIPMILENILQISANLVITAMVGRLLANDISAQGICIRITDTLWCFYKGVAIGATEKGMLHVSKAGGIYPGTYLGQKVRIIHEGNVVYGAVRNHGSCGLW